jgi:hypothetical protein
VSSRRFRITWGKRFLVFKMFILPTADIMVNETNEATTRKAIFTFKFKLP